MAARRASLAVELLALAQRNSVSLPDGFVDEATSLEIAGRLGPTTLVANVPMISVAAAEKPGVANAGACRATTGCSPDAAKVDAPEAKDDKDAKEAKPGFDIRHGMVLVLTDSVSKQRMWRRIDCQ